VTCRPSAASSPVSAGSISASSEPDGTAASRSSGTPSASESSPSIGPMFPDLETSRPLTGQGSNGLTFWPEASLASRSVSLGAKRGLPTIVGFGPSLPPPFAYYSRTSSSWRNVPGLLAGHGGMGNVLGDLADLGYDAEWCVISAADVGAPHLRRRVWIVAYPDSTRSQGLQWRGALGPEGAPSVGSPSDSGASSARNVADTTSGRRQGSGEPFASVHPTTRALGQAIDALDGRFAGEWSVEPDVGRVAHGVPARVDRLRALGNAVVPQVVQVIGEALIRGFD
jgi:hypothetical protein